MKKSRYIISLIVGLVLCACSPHFDKNKADSILEKTTLSEKDYDDLIELYEISMDDALEFAKKDPSDMSSQDREEVLTMFLIGKRLIMDEDKLTASQNKEVERITAKGTEVERNDSDQ